MSKCFFNIGGLEWVTDSSVNGEGVVDVMSNEVIISGLRAWGESRWRLRWLRLQAEHSIGICLSLRVCHLRPANCLSHKLAYKPAGHWGSTYHSLRMTAVRSEQVFVSCPAPLMSWLTASSTIPRPARTSVWKVGSGRQVVADAVLARTTAAAEARAKRIAAIERALK